MALSTSGVWEIRPTVGSDTNGGGFDPSVTSPGTDFSQQNAAQIAFTDLVATSTTTATSAGNPFTSAHVGNYLRITSGTGWTTGIYCITAVSSGTATFDRAIATNGSTGGNGNLGGALATFGGLPTALNAIDGNTVYIKASGNMTLTAAYNIVSHVYRWIGYTTTRTDNGQATITTATNSTILITFGGAYLTEFWNIKFTTTAGTPAQGVSLNNDPHVQFNNCTFDGFTISVDGGQPFVFAATQNQLILRNCEIRNCTTQGIRFYTPIGVYLIGCYIHGNTGDGIHTEGGPAKGVIQVIDCVIKSNTGNGINVATQSSNCTALFIRNSAIINNGGAGIITAGDGMLLYLENNIIDSNATYGLNVTSAGTQFKYQQIGGNNAYWNNTTAARSANAVALPGDITLTGDPFTNRSIADFTLNNTGGAGAACRGAGASLGF